jgi:hypothetical protein
MYTVRQLRNKFYIFMIYKMDNLTQMRICVEKPLAKEEHIMKHLSDTSNSHHHFKKLSAAFLTQKMWSSNAKITVSFVSSPNTIKNVDWTPIAVLKGLKNNNGSEVSLDPIEEEIRKLSPIEAVKKIVRERIQPLVGLKFVFVPTGGHVRIGFNPHGGSYSLVGTDCVKSNDKITMNFGWLDASTIIHEFGHVLGLIHEHQNPKGKPIQWDDSKVYSWAKQTQGWDQQTTYHNIIERYKIEQLNASKYDKHSVMLYFFPKSLTTDHKGTSSNHKLSREDVKYISKVYPGGSMTPVEFYMNVYGESINDPEKGGKFDLKILLYIIGCIVALGIIIFLFSKIRGKGWSKSTKLLGYSEWRTAHGGSPRSFTPKRYSMN